MVQQEPDQVRIPLAGCHMKSRLAVGQVHIVPRGIAARIHIRPVVEEDAHGIRTTMQDGPVQRREVVDIMGVVPGTRLRHVARK